ncbi:hypothetical protein G3T14_07100 [Methylobacterium sp. BTF04]|uniref:hypothetical protein n=1 Tax=Methylobacterium sp. BTF04 TaxID=2708300 RepID=UPI0013D63092|nr:hypothetical protein [Methylobacterium sp. BTF04]NEU11895.1 hypothetical protein [Methylobacterium sp. BTF04]
MKRLAAAGLVTVLTTAICVAEPGPGGPQNPPPQTPGMADGGRPDGPRRGSPDGEREGGWRHHPPMIGMKGAHLRFRRGEAAIDFKCAADDTTKACVDALMPLVDKLLQVR